MTETDLAARLHRDLGALATDAEWSATASSGQDQGNYTDPIADGKEAAGVDGDLDDATAAQLKTVRRVALSVCLDRLELHYSQAVDTKGLGFEEKSSQVTAAIARARENLLGQIAVGVSLRGKRRPDYDVNLGDRDYSSTTGLV